MMKSKLLVLLALLSVSCQRVSSRLDVTTEPVDQVEKNQCASVQLENNCWASSIQLVRDCMKTDNLNGTFTQDQQFCQSDEGLLVQFVDPLQAQEGTENLDLEVYKDGVKCFSMQKRGDNLRLKDTPYGDLSITKKENGDIDVQCFYQQNLQISGEFVQTCLNQNGQEDEPGVAIAQKKVERERLKHFMFSFVGLGLPLQTSVFECRLN